MQPVWLKPHRALLAAAALFFVVTGLSLLRRKRLAAGVTAALVVAVVAVAVWPAPAAPPPGFADTLVASLRRYEGTPYYWGGEKASGIDCSGLIRRGLMDACVTEGWKNPALWRRAAELWWHDSSARALRDGYRGWTRRLGTADSIRTADESLLQPGDLAVTENGVHVLAYLGGGTWIQADPGAGRVIALPASAENGWFAKPVVLLRWAVP